jgi:hypothetical protein
MKSKFGLILVIVFFVVSFTSLHTLIPGIKYVKPGLLTTILLIPLIIKNLRNVEWSNPLGKWRLLFLLVIIPGIFIGFGTGRVRSVFVTNGQEFLGSFLATCVFVQSIGDLRRINQVVLVTSCIMAFYVIIHHGEGPGMVVDENDVGLVLVMLLPFSYFNFINSVNKIQKILFGSFFLLILLAIATTFSRGAMVGTLPTLLIIWLKSRKKVLTVVCIVVILIAVILWGPPGLLNEFKSIGQADEGTAGSRRYFWDLSIELFKKKPIFGVGARCWGNAVWSGLISLPRHVSNSTPHSVYFQLLSELGLVGVFVWVTLTVKAFLIGNRIKNASMNYVDTCDNMNEMNDVKLLLTFTNSLLVGMIGGLICGMFLSFLFYPHFYVYIGFLQVAYNIARQRIRFNI